MTLETAGTIWFIAVTVLWVHTAITIINAKDLDEKDE